MQNKIKVVVISHALVVPVNQNRWRELAKDPAYEVHILTPRHWETGWFKEKVVFKTNFEQDDNFNLHPVETTSTHNWGHYFIKGLKQKLLEINPDLIYIVHEESIFIHHQIYRVRNWFLPKTKIIFFSMNADGIDRWKLSWKMKLLMRFFIMRDINANTEVALAHSKECLESLRSLGYKKPVYLQTNVGVDESIFRSDDSIRKNIRSKIGFEDKFVIGYAGRLTFEKGLDNLLEAMPLEGINWAILFVGDGVDREEIEQLIEKNNWREHIHITGFISQEKVADYMNAMDLFFIGTKIIDSFPLVPVQAQACGVPVIACDKPSIPWQLQNTAEFFKVDDSNDLKAKLIKLIQDKEKLSKLEIIGRTRSLEYFCIKGMTENFKKIINQVMTSDFIYHEKNEDYTQWKAYR